MYIPSSNRVHYHLFSGLEISLSWSVKLKKVKHSYVFDFIPILIQLQIQIPIIFFSQIAIYLSTVI